MFDEETSTLVHFSTQVFGAKSKPIPLPTSKKLHTMEDSGKEGDASNDGESSRDGTSTTTTTTTRTTTAQDSERSNDASSKEGGQAIKDEEGKGLKVFPVPLMGLHVV